MYQYQQQQPSYLRHYSPYVPSAADCPPNRPVFNPRTNHCLTSSQQQRVDQALNRTSIRRPSYSAPSAAQCPPGLPLYNPRTYHCIQDTQNNRARIASYGFAPAFRPPQQPSKLYQAPVKMPQPSKVYQAPLMMPQPSKVYQAPVMTSIKPTKASNKSVHFAPQPQYYQEQIPMDITPIREEEEEEEVEPFVPQYQQLQQPGPLKHIPYLAQQWQAGHPIPFAGSQYAPSKQQHYF